MQKLACVALILLIGFSGVFFVVSPVRGETQKSGLITSDTTWTAAGSPYRLTGPVGVATGVTLTIEPGVTVDFGKFYMQINGTLNAQGTADNKIILTSFSGRDYTGAPQNIQFMPLSTPWNKQTGSGCIISNAQISIVSIVIKDCSPKISSCSLSEPLGYTIDITGGSASITQNTIDLTVGGGISVSKGTPTISDNQITGTYYQTGITAGGVPIFNNNTLINLWTGISASGQTYFEGNIVSNCANIGIECLSSTVAISRNQISNNKIGVSGSAIIQNNAITNNTIAIKNPTSQGTINENNIVGNTQGIVLDSADDVYAAHNWWGTTDSNAIRQTNWDYKNDYNLGIVTIDPVSTAPNPDAPVPQDDTPATTPKSTTTQPPATTTEPPQDQNTQHASPTPLGDQSSNAASSLPFDPLEAVVIVVVVLAIVTVAFSLFRVYRRVDKPKE
ncbi:MAG: right-handed parallel beta-helix repeat-containing protein [Candidatus Bathyarchaeota archaeon]|nr:right-handed parallel beta-helix repeat-containing protein [Candidatus Bathyarchaeota archaeon]